MDNLRNKALWLIKVDYNNLKDTDKVMVDEFTEQKINEVIKQHYWNLLFQKVNLSQLAVQDDSIGGFLYKSPLPADFSFVIKVLTERCDISNPSMKYLVRLENNVKYLYTKTDNIVLYYISKISDYDFIEETMKSYIIYAIASEFCFPLTSNEKLLQSINTSLQEKKLTAMNTDVRQKKIDTNIIASDVGVYNV